MSSPPERAPFAAPLRQLRRRWLAVAAIWIALWLGSYGWLTGRWPFAGRWLVVSAPILAYQLWLLWRFLPLNHRPNERAVLPTFGPGNRLTLARGFMLVLVSGFLFSPWPGGGLAWLPALFYALASIVDYLDGYAARLANHATLLGEKLDMEYDGLAILVVSLLAVWYGQLPWWYLSLGLARYLFLWGLWWRQRRKLPVYEIPPSSHRRIIAGFQMGFLSAVLWPIWPAVGTTIAGTVFAAAMAASFARDWLVAAGKLRPGSAGYERWRRRLVVWMTRLLPPVWRILLLVSVWAMLASLPSQLPPPSWRDLFASWQWPDPGRGALLVTILFVTMTVLMGLGVMGRVLAIALIFPIGFDMIARGVTFANSVALLCILLLMLLGTGAWSLWQPEEPLMVRRAGETGLQAERGLAQ